MKGSSGHGLGDGQPADSTGTSGSSHGTDSDEGPPGQVRNEGTETGARPGTGHGQGQPGRPGNGQGELGPPASGQAEHAPPGYAQDGLVPGIGHGLGNGVARSAVEHAEPGIGEGPMADVTLTAGVIDSNLPADATVPAVFRESA